VENNVGRCMSLIRSLIGVASLFLISVCSAQEVDLQITDTRGRALQAISAGTPFMIRVQVDGSGVISGRPTVAHDEHLVVRGSSSKQQSINGVLSRQFEYLVLLDETVPEGAYTIGPAVVTLNGDPQQSETRTITVGEHAQAEEKSDAEQGLRLSVDKDKAGEARPYALHIFDDSLRCIYRLYTITTSSDLTHPARPLCHTLYQPGSCAWTISSWEQLQCVSS